MTRPSFEPPQQVDVWRFRLDVPSSAIPELLAVLSGDEARRAEGLVRAADRERWIASRAALRVILSSRLGIAPSRLQFAVDPLGKPRLDLREHDHRLQFNLSHSADIALLAVATDVPVGIDIENVREFPDMLAVARRFFCPEEVAELRKLPDDQVPAAFFRCWTRKEACLKATGTGLSRPLDSVFVSTQERGPSCVSIAGLQVNAPDALQLVTLDPGRRYRGALAVHTSRSFCVRAIDYPITPCQSARSSPVSPWPARFHRPS